MIKYNNILDFLKNWISGLKQWIANNRALLSKILHIYLLPGYWVISVFVIFMTAINSNDSQYAKMWDQYAIVSTIVYGYCFYIPQIFFKKNDGKTLFIIVLFFISTFYCLNITFGLIETKTKFINYAVNHYGSLVLIIIYTITDKMLGGIKSSGVDLFPAEKQFFLYVDLPCLCAFIIITLFAHFSDFESIEHFVGGASAFQLVGFNTAFTILLIYFEYQKQQGGPQDEKV